MSCQLPLCFHEQLSRLSKPSAWGGLLRLSQWESQLLQGARLSGSQRPGMLHGSSLAGGGRGSWSGRPRLRWPCPGC